MTPDPGQGRHPTSGRAQRSSEVDGREPASTARETDEDDREEQVQRIIAAADERDNEADARDAIADERDRAASLAAFLTTGNSYDVTLKARRSAAGDRLDSKIDRTSSAQDRSTLTDGHPGERSL